MADLIHTSKIRILQDQPPERRAFVEGFDEPLLFGVHGGIKHFYRMEPRRDLPATLDHMVAAVGGWLTGTLSGALAVRRIPNHPDRVSSLVEGDIENVDGIIRITRIRVHYKLRIPAGTRDRAQRALDTHQAKCPAAMSVKGAIDIAISAEIEEA